MNTPTIAPVVVVAVIVGFVGPRLTAPQDSAAGAPFVYTPPAGFVPGAVEDALRTSPGMQQMWLFRDPGASATPSISLSQTSSTARIQEPELADLARGMPAIFRQVGTQWTEVRHEVRVRADGSRVGLIEGETDKGTVRGRVMQLVFPNDRGTAIVTASFPNGESAKWEPQIEASIAAATGVATRVGSPPGWMYAAWAAGGAMLAYLAMALGVRGKRAAVGGSVEPPSNQEEASG